MPRDLSGVYTPLRDWEADAANSVPFSPEKWNDQDQDFADALNDLPLKTTVPTFVPPETDPTTVNPGSFAYDGGTFKMVISTGGSQVWADVTTGTPVDLSLYYTKSEVDTALAGKAASSHTHIISNVTGLQTALDGKAASSHTHTASEISDSTTTGRALLTAADAAAVRTTLSLGTLATASSVNLSGSEATGTLATARMPALTGDVTTTAGAVATTIANDAVTTAKIASAAVTYAKIQNVSAQYRLLGRNSSGAGTAEEVSFTQMMDWISTTQGAVLYRGASTWAALAPGTDGQFLRTNGAGQNPSWSTNSTGTTLLTSGTASAAATLDIVLSSYTAYRGIIVELFNLVPATSGASLFLRFSSDAGASFNTTSYFYYSGGGGSTTTSSLIVSGAVSNSSSAGVSARIEIPDQTNASRYPKARMHSVEWDGTTVSQFVGTGLRASAQVTSAVRFYFSSGNISSGSYAVYGLN